MSQLDQNTDHGKYSWVVMWSSAATPLITDYEAALAFHKKAHDECSEANPIFGIMLPTHAKCIADKTNAAAILIFPELADPEEDGGDFDKSELIMFQSDWIDVQHENHENKFNLRILPNIKWFGPGPTQLVPFVNSSL